MIPTWVKVLWGIGIAVASLATVFAMVYLVLFILHPPGCS